MSRDAPPVSRVNRAKNGVRGGHRGDQFGHVRNTSLGAAALYAIIRMAIRRPPHDAGDESVMPGRVSLVGARGSYEQESLMAQGRVLSYQLIMAMSVTELPVGVGVDHAQVATGVSPGVA